MSCQSCIPDCETIQIIEPKGDLLVDTAGTNSDVDERGELELTEGQTSAVVEFTTIKLSADYNFEYLYVDALGENNPGAVVVIPTIKTVEGFGVVFAGLPIGEGYVLHWRVTIVRTTEITQTDAPEDLYLQMPRTSTMAVTFVNPRSTTAYGFTELSVENLTDPPAFMPLVHVQVYQKTLSGFLLAVNPIPPNDHFYLRVRTP